MVASIFGMTQILISHHHADTEAGNLGM